MRRPKNSARSRSARTVREAAIHVLEPRCLMSASLTVSTPLMVYNAVKGTTSVAETLTLTNTGDAALTLGASAFTLNNDPSFSTQDASHFLLPNKSSAPATLAPGVGFSLQVEYSASLVGTQSALLDIMTSDPVNPTQVVTLHGIGTVGQYGSNQPSLATILQAYDIPTYVGEGFDDDQAANDSVYPEFPDATSQEVVMPRLVKAGTGPVTIQVLASFDAAATEPYTLGYYNPGELTTKNELFYTPTSESQSVYIQPQGSTSFDPGSNPFGFYFVSNIKDNGVNRIGYSEDTFNTWDPTIPRKFRFFPLENSSGTIIANSYILTSTEYNAPAGYDFTNMVAIVRNVQPAAAGPVLGLVDTNALPGTGNMIFSVIKNQNSTVGDTVHSSDILTINNPGTSALTISSVSSNVSAWGLVNPPAFPLTIAAGSSANLTVKFLATTEPSVPYNETSSGDYPKDGGVYYGSLTITSNATYNGIAAVPLRGWWQEYSEDENEPSLQSIVNLLAGYSTNINSAAIPELTEASTTTATYYGEEVVSDYWAAADSSRPVTVQQLSAYHTEGNTGSLYYYNTGSSKLTTLITTQSDNGQTLLPLNTSNSPSTAMFSTADTFGFKVDGEDSNDANNALKTGNGHHVRFYPVRDASGNAIPNTYILAMDYSATPENFDFQDNVYVITNMRPAASPGVAPPAPTDIQATNATNGVSVTWAPDKYTTLAGYNVYRGTSAATTTTLLNPGGVITTPYYFDSSAPASSTLYYRVTAVDSGTARAQSIGTYAHVTTAAAVGVGSISGTVFLDNNDNGVYDTGDVALGGWGVFVDTNNNGVFDAGIDTRVISNSAGGYTFSNLVPGTYHVAEVTPAGYTRTVPSGSSYTITVTSGQAVTGKDFGVAAGGTISGTMFEDYDENGVQSAGEPDLAGWGCFIDYNGDGIFDGSDVRAITNASGFYSFPNVPPGNYFISQVTPAGWKRVSPAIVPYSVTVTAGQTTTLNFAEAQASISGKVFNDANGDGVFDAGDTGSAGWGVFIDVNGSGTFGAGDTRVITDANGNFTFLGLAPGTYNINEKTPAGYTRTTPGITGFVLNVSAGQLVTGENFGYQYTATPAAIPAGQIAMPADPWDDKLKKSARLDPSISVDAVAE
jgi:protocatechuate 3,4-dioxygenase beta subunit